MKGREGFLFVFKLFDYNSRVVVKILCKSQIIPLYFLKFKTINEGTNTYKPIVSVKTQSPLHYYSGSSPYINFF